MDEDQVKIVGSIDVSNQPESLEPADAAKQESGMKNMDRATISVSQIHNSEGRLGGAPTYE